MHEGSRNRSLYYPLIKENAMQAIESTPVVFRLSRERLAQLQSIARKLAAARDRRFTLSDLMREALEASFPSGDGGNAASSVAGSQDTK